MGIEKRKDRRYPFRVKTVLVSGRNEIVAQTEDVSFKGVFVRTDTPLPERHLLRLKLTLPPDGDEYTVTGMVARAVPAQEGRLPGAGIQFYGAASTDLERWNRFIRWVAAGGQAPRPAAAVPAGTPDTVHRRYPRYAATLKVNLRSVGELEQLYTHNVSKGGMFVGTSLDLPPETALRLTVIHPRTGEPFPLDAVVRWRSGPPSAGLGLEFTGLDEPRREAFIEFVRSEIPVEEVTFVAEGDPHLVAQGPREPGDPVPEPDEDIPLDELDES